VVGGGPVGHGYAALRHHTHRHHGAGGDRRPTLRAVLLWPAVGHGHPGRDAGPVPPRGQSIHRVRVSGTAVRRAHEIPDQLPLSGSARDVVRHDHRRAGRGVLRHLWMESVVVGGPDGGSDRHLHDDRRRAGRDLGGRKADGAHRLRADRGDGDSPGAAPGGTRPCAGPGGRGGPAPRLRFLFRPDQRFHVLVRPDRRHLPHVVVLRDRPEPGAALHHRKIGRSGSELAVDERLLEDSAPGTGAAHGRSGIRLLRLPGAAAAVQPRGRASRSCGGARSVRDAR